MADSTEGRACSKSIVVAVWGGDGRGLPDMPPQEAAKVVPLVERQLGRPRARLVSLPSSPAVTGLSARQPAKQPRRHPQHLQRPSENGHERWASRIFARFGRSHGFESPPCGLPQPFGVDDADVALCRGCETDGLSYGLVDRQIVGRCRCRRKTSMSDRHRHNPANGPSVVVSLDPEQPPSVRRHSLLRF